MILDILEYLAFGMSLVSVYCYGRHKVLGPIAGIVAAILFIIWGLMSGILAAFFTNVVFLGLHIWNYFKIRG